MYIRAMGFCVGGVDAVLTFCGRIVSIHFLRVFLQLVHAISTIAKLKSGGFTLSHIMKYSDGGN